MVSFFTFYFQHSHSETFSLCLIVHQCYSTGAAINAVTMPVVEETARMKKTRLAGLDTRGKPTEPSFLRKHKEPASEGSTDALVESDPATSDSFQPAWGFWHQDFVAGSTKHSMDWSYHSITPSDYRDIVVVFDLSGVEHMGAKAMATVSSIPFCLSVFVFSPFILLTLFHALQGNAYFQGAMHHAKSWNRSSKSKDKDLKKLKMKYKGLQAKMKNKEKGLADAHAKLVQLRDERDRTIDAYMLTEEFVQVMRAHMTQYFLTSSGPAGMPELVLFRSIIRKLILGVTRALMMPPLSSDFA